MPQHHGAEEEADEQAGPTGDQEAGETREPGEHAVVLLDESQFRILGEVADAFGRSVGELVTQDPPHMTPPEAALG